MSTVKLEEDEALLLFCAIWYDNLNFEFSNRDFSFSFMENSLPFLSYRLNIEA
jgi:hypothetical protein